MRTQGLITTAIGFGHQVALVCPAGVDAASPPDGATLMPLPGYRWRPLWAASRIASRHPLRAPRVAAIHVRQARSDIDKLQPELVIVSESMSWSLAQRLIPADVPVLYDAHNVEFMLYRELSARAASTLDRITLEVDARRVARDEARLVGRSSTVIAVSEDDRLALHQEYGHEHIDVVPSSVPTPTLRTNPAATGPELLFVGALDYQPNAEAVAELATVILPTVRRSVPGAVLTVIGRGAGPATRKLVTASPGATLLDDVHDLAPYYARARCVALPLRSGGGTKLKAFESMAYGVPMVCTTKTVRGIGLRPDEAVIADSTDAIVEGVLTFLRDPALAARVGESARHAFDDRLSWEAAVPGPLSRALEGTIQRGPR